MQPVSEQRMNFWSWLSRFRRRPPRLLNPPEAPNFAGAMAQTRAGVRAPAIPESSHQPDAREASTSTECPIEVVKIRFPGQLIRWREEGFWLSPRIPPTRVTIFRSRSRPSLWATTYTVCRSRGSRITVLSAQFGDVIHAETLPDGTLRFVSVIEPGRWSINTWMLGLQPIRSGILHPVFERVSAEGGFACEDPWMGGMLWVFLPPEADYQPQADISACLARDGPEPG